MNTDNLLTDHLGVSLVTTTTVLSTRPHCDLSVVLVRSEKYLTPSILYILSSMKSSTSVPFSSHLR